MVKILSKKKLFLLSSLFLLLFLLVACSEKKSSVIVDELNPQNKNVQEIISTTDGFSANFLGEYEVDNSLEGIRTRLFNANTTIDIFYDNFTGNNGNKENYFNYGNRTIIDDENHKIIERKREVINGFDVNRIEWERKALSKLKSDQKFYASYEIAINPDEIYTILMKSTEKIEDFDFIIKNFKVIDKVTEAPPINYDVVEKDWSEETLAYYNKTFINSDQLQFGLFDSNFFDREDKTIKLEEALDYKFNTYLGYQMIGENEFPTDILNELHEDGKTVELTMQYNRDESILYEILDGDFDDYLTKYANEMKEFGHPILFRLNNEMNGDWVLYSAYHASKDTDLYTETWKYIHNLFKDVGVDNVLWVWNPNHNSKPDYKWNHALAYYPGSEYVDIIGLTAYNTGTYYEGEVWSEFESLYDKMYEKYIEWFDHPFMITEFASSSIGGNKVEWIEGMFNSIEKYDRVKIAVWWSWQDFDVDKNPARIYFLDENKETTEAFRKGLINFSN